MLERNQYVYNAYRGACIEKEKIFVSPEKFCYSFNRLLTATKMFSKTNQSRRFIKKFLLTIVVLSSINSVSSAPKFIEDLRRMPFYHGNMYKCSSLRDPKNNYHLNNYPIIIDSYDNDHRASVSAFHGRRGFGLTDPSEIKMKSLHERHIDLPIVKEDVLPGTENTIELPDDYYFNYDNDYYSNQLLNANDYAFLFGVRSMNPEDYDDGASL